MDDHDRKITLAGLSLGAAVCLLWAEEHLDRVARIVRVAGAGLKEPLWGSLLMPLRSIQISSFVSSVSKILRPVFDPSHLVSGLLAPDYGVDQRMPETLRQRSVPVSVVGGTWDYIHRAHIDRW